MIVVPSTFACCIIDHISYLTYVWLSYIFNAARLLRDYTGLAGLNRRLITPEGLIDAGK